MSESRNHHLIQLEDLIELVCKLIEKNILIKSENAASKEHLATYTFLRQQADQLLLSQEKSIAMLLTQKRNILRSYLFFADAIFYADRMSPVDNVRKSLILAKHEPILVNYLSEAVHLYCLAAQWIHYHQHEVTEGFISKVYDDIQDIYYYLRCRKRTDEFDYQVSSLAKANTYFLGLQSALDPNYFYNGWELYEWLEHQHPALLENAEIKAYFYLIKIERMKNPALVYLDKTSNPIEACLILDLCSHYVIVIDKIQQLVGSYIKAASTNKKTLKFHVQANLQAATDVANNTAIKLACVDKISRYYEDVMLNMHEFKISFKNYLEHQRVKMFIWVHILKTVYGLHKDENINTLIETFLLMTDTLNCYEGVEASGVSNDGIDLINTLVDYVILFPAQIKKTTYIKLVDALETAWKCYLQTLPEQGASVEHIEYVVLGVANVVNKMMAKAFEGIEAREMLVNAVGDELTKHRAEVLSQSAYAKFGDYYKRLCQPLTDIDELIKQFDEMDAGLPKKVSSIQKTAKNSSSSKISKSKALQNTQRQPDGKEKNGPKPPTATSNSSSQGHSPLATSITSTVAEPPNVAATDESSPAPSGEVSKPKLPIHRRSKSLESATYRKPGFYTGVAYSFFYRGEIISCRSRNTFIEMQRNNEEEVPLDSMVLK